MISKRFQRFILVGGSNAALHFAVLNVSYSLVGLTKLYSSIIATVCAMLYSFTLNKGFVFKSKEEVRSEVLAFVAVTASGMLLLHNIVFALCVRILGNNASIVSLIHNLTHNRISADVVIINLSTIAGAALALIWNYNGYRLFVFKNREAAHEFEDQEV